MLEKLTIVNFQAHKRLEINFDKHITTVVGPTDSGKSSVIRALNWIGKNDIRGDQFIKYGEKETQVSLVVDNKTITRIKSNKENKYLLDEKVFDAVSTNVPPEIAKVLNLASCNFQSQHDSCFWLNDSPAEVSRQLNSVINLEIMDEVMAEVNVSLKRKKTEDDITKEKIKKIRDELVKTDYIFELDENLVDIEKANKSLELLEKTTNSINALVTEFELKEQEKKGLKPCLKIATILSSDSTELIGLNKKIEQLTLLISEGDKNNSLLNIKIPRSIETEQVLAQCSVVSERYKSLSNLMESISDSSTEMNTLKNQYNEAQEIYKQLINERCPLCGK